MSPDNDEQLDQRPAIKLAGASQPTSERPSDDDADDSLYLELAPRLRAIAISKFGVPEADTTELVQDVFMTYLTNPANVRGDVRRYLVGGICNASRSYWRVRRARERLFADVDDLLGIAETDEDIAAELASLSALKATLARLGRRCREALCRYYLEDEDTVTIAAALETSPGNVNYLMHVCRKRARAIYDEITRKP